MDILVIKLGAIGDVIRTTAILKGLKEKYKNCRIEWVTKKESFDILKNNGLLRKSYIIEDALDKLKNKRYNLAICLDDDYEACSLASKVNSKRIIGSYLKGNEKAYTKDSSPWFDMGLISRFGKKKADELKAKNRKTYQQIMHKILGLNYKKQEPILALNEKELGFGRKFAKNHGVGKKDIVIGVNTGAGGRWEDKKLGIEETAELIDRLNSQIKSPEMKISGELKNQRFLSNARILLFGGPEETDRNEKIKKTVKTGIIDAGCKNSLMQFASLVDLCDVLVTSDSLALHIGVALRKKVVVFFGPTSSSEIELYSRGIKIIPKKGCLCCYKPKCDTPPEYDVNEMVKAVKKLLN